LSVRSKLTARDEKSSGSKSRGGHVSNRKARFAAVSRSMGARCQKSEGRHEPRIGHESVRVVGMIAVPPESVKLGKNQRLRGMFQSAKRLIDPLPATRVFPSMLASHCAEYKP
jgi:hypothetical protein